MQILPSREYMLGWLYGYYFAKGIKNIDLELNNTEELSSAYEELRSK